MFHGNVRLVDFELGTNLRKRVGGGGGVKNFEGERGSRWVIKMVYS